MKKYLIKYLDDLRVPILMNFLTWWIFFIVIIVIYLLGGSVFVTSLEHNHPIIFYIFFMLPFTCIIPPLFYQLYKRKWLNVGFLLLVWLSPIALFHINSDLLENITEILIFLQI